MTRSKSIQVPQGKEKLYTRGSWLYEKVGQNDIEINEQPFEGDYSCGCTYQLCHDENTPRV